MTAGLRVRGLSAGYAGRAVIDALDLPDLEPGQILSLVGPNAAGKSTLLRALAGLRPSRGSVTLGDRELNDLNLAERARLVTYMPQTLPQGLRLTVLETLIGAIRASPMEGGAPDDDARHGLSILARLGMEDLALRRLDQLSGGQKQLASLAQAVVRGPRLLLLDEPTSALDLRHQLVVLRLVQALAAERAMAVVIVLHDLEAAARVSDRVAVLSEGRVVASGEPGQAIRPDVLAQVYGVKARVEVCEQGRLRISVDDVL